MSNILPLGITSLDLLESLAVSWLTKLITIPSFSREENQTADYLGEILQKQGISFNRIENNIWAKNKFFSPEKPTLLLNSHHDTVKPNASWTFSPFEPKIQENRLYGLGSNDAGASLVSLLAVFIFFFGQELEFNFVFLASAEEEISGKNGIEKVLNSKEFPKIDCAIVGEPTQMKMAVAEKGLLVVEALAKGKSGHAAREEGINAIDIALDDILFLRKNPLPKNSPFLGKTTLKTTLIQAGSQHNVIPDECRFTIDCRISEQYTLEDIMNFLQKNLKSEVSPRSMRLRPSFISIDHFLVQSGQRMGIEVFGSPTLSDQALMPFPSIKMGVGDSARSHTADEFVYIDEIKDGIRLYANFIKGLILPQKLLV